MSPARQNSARQPILSWGHPRDGAQWPAVASSVHENQHMPDDAGWRAAAQAAAERIHAERDLSDRCFVQSPLSRPVVCFGDVQVPVGPGTDVLTPEELHAVLDEAVAWRRLEGPGRWLARDQAQVDEMWADATASLDAYNRAGSLLAADLERTTGLASTWTVQVTPQEAPLYLPAGVPRPATPQLMVELAFGPGGGGGYGLPPLEGLTLGEAASELMYVCDDDVIEELWGRWPLCASHVAELFIDDGDAQVSWTCPADQRVWAPVGQLQPDHIQRD